MKHIIEKELTWAQRRDPHYQWDAHGTTGPSRKARSLHDVIVRNHVGHKSTAQHIYQHGLPRLFAASGRRDATHRVKSGRWCSATAAENRVGSLDLASGRCSSATAAEHRDLDQLAGNPSEVHAALEEAAHWLAALASAIFSHKDDPRMPALRMLAARPEHLSPARRQERQSCKANIRKIAEEFAHAKRLAKDRDIGKRKFDDMSDADQQLLEDFDTEMLHNRRKTIVVERLPSFRSQMSSASAAAHHAAVSSSATAGAAAEHASPSPFRSVSAPRKRRNKYRSRNHSPTTPSASDGSQSGVEHVERGGDLLIVKRI